MTKKTANTATSTGSALVREIADIMDDAGLYEVEYATDEVEIRLSRGATVAAPAHVMPTPVVPPATPVSVSPTAESAHESSADTTADHPGAVTAPMVGTAYLAPEPGADDFIKVGDSVKAGQTLLIIEAMKVMNPITAPAAGVVSAIMVTNAQPVEYGEALVIVE